MRFPTAQYVLTIDSLTALYAASRHQKEDDTVWNLQFSANVSGMKILLFDDIVTRGISFIQCG